MQCTVSRETYEKLRRVQDLLRHTIPNGDLSAILDRALTLLLADLSRTKFASTDRPRGGGTSSSRTRHIPAAVKRDVWARDGGRCAFQGEQGRCGEIGFLEFHHVVPYADGGETSAANLELRCRAHNQYEADLWSGMARSLVAEKRAYSLARKRNWAEQTHGRRRVLHTDSRDRIASWCLAAILRCDKLGPDRPDAYNSSCAPSCSSRSRWSRSSQLRT